MPRANAALGAVGASALTIDAHAHGDKRNADHSQNNNIDRCPSKPPLVNHRLLYTIPTCQKGTGLFWSLLSAETSHLPHHLSCGEIVPKFAIYARKQELFHRNLVGAPKSPSIARIPGLVERGSSLFGLRRKQRRRRCWSHPHRSRHAWAWDGRSGRASQPAARWRQPSRHQTDPEQAGCRTG